MFCPKCGEKIDDTSIFCMKCGAKIMNDANSTTNATTTNNTTTNTTTNKFVQGECTRCSYRGEMEFVQYKFGFLIRFGLPCVLFVILLKPFGLIVAFIGQFIASELLSMAKVVRCPNCHSTISIFSNRSITKGNVKKDDVVSPTINNVGNKVEKVSTNNDVGKSPFVLSQKMKIIILLVMIGIGVLLFSKLWGNGGENKQETSNQVESIEESKDNQQNDNLYDNIKEENVEEIVVENEEENVEAIVEENDSVLSDEAYLAIINTYNGVSNYMNGNELVEFDIVALQTICDNWEVIKESGIFEAPIDVEEYVAMREGPTVEFYYDGGVSLIWIKETNELYISYDGE